jgi:hypothetical protein
MESMNLRKIGTRLLLLAPAVVVALAVIGALVATGVVRPSGSGRPTPHSGTTGHGSVLARGHGAAASAGAAAGQASRKPTVSLPSPRPPGILDTQRGPFSTSEFVVRNAWHGQVGSEQVWVYAGATPMPSATRTIEAPSIRIYTGGEDGDEPASAYRGSFSPPGADSPLSITGFSGNVLTLRSEGGKVYRFDLQTNRFL